MHQAGKRPKVLKLAIDTTCDEVHISNNSLPTTASGTTCFTPFHFTEDGFPWLLCCEQAMLEGTMELCDNSLWSMSFEDAGGIRIELTADAAFAAPDIYNYCEQNHITYYIAIAGNTALKSKSKQFVQSVENLAATSVPSLNLKTP
ncbi:MAG: transposase [Cyanobacteriota/Melainabacteria group bacterium]